MFSTTEYDFLGLEHSEIENILDRANDSDQHYACLLRQAFRTTAIWQKCYGPWLVLDHSRVMFDGIRAGFGLGYNATPLFGIAHYSGAWLNDPLDEDVQAVRKAHSDFIHRKPHFDHCDARSKTVRDILGEYIRCQILDQFETTAVTLNRRIQSAFDRAAECLDSQSAQDFQQSIRFDQLTVYVRLKEPKRYPVNTLLQFGILSRSIDQDEKAFGSRLANAPDSNLDQYAVIEVPLRVSDDDLAILAERVVAAWCGQRLRPVQVAVQSVESNYRFTTRLLAAKQQVALGRPCTAKECLEFLSENMPVQLDQSGTVVFLSGENWGRYRELIDRLQKTIYEPARQTSLSTFDRLFRHPSGYGVVTEVDGDVSGFSCAGALGLFPDERGTQDDPFRDDPATLYPLDLTVAKEYQGFLGIYLKRAMMLLAIGRGCNAFHGRNRDRLAAGMWAINLSLGSYQFRHLKDDYPDQQAYRDCIYYRCPMRLPSMKASGAERIQLGTAMAEIAELINF